VPLTGQLSHGTALLQQYMPDLAVNLKRRSLADRLRTTKTGGAKADSRVPTVHVCNGLDNATKSIMPRGLKVFCPLDRPVPLFELGRGGLSPLATGSRSSLPVGGGVSPPLEIKHKQGRWKWRCGADGQWQMLMEGRSLFPGCAFVLAKVPFGGSCLRARSALHSNRTTRRHWITVGFRLLIFAGIFHNDSRPTAGPQHFHFRITHSIRRVGIASIEETNLERECSPRELACEFSPLADSHAPVCGSSFC